MIHNETLTFPNNRVWLFFNRLTKQVQFLRIITLNGLQHQMVSPGAWLSAIQSQHRPGLQKDRSPLALLTGIVRNTQRAIKMQVIKAVNSIKRAVVFVPSLHVCSTNRTQPDGSKSICVCRLLASLIKIIFQALAFVCVEPKLQQLLHQLQKAQIILVVRLSNSLTVTQQRRTTLNPNFNNFMNHGHHKSVPACRFSTCIAFSKYKMTLI